MTEGFMTPIFYISYQTAKKFVTLSLKGDNQFHAALEQGNTNLHIIALLLHYGADIHRKNNKGKSALSIAIESKNVEIIK
jgi:ankyrin repeat protein